MAEWFHFFSVAFAAVFVVVEPFGLVPTFAALTRGRPTGEVERIARRASLVGAVVLALFTLLGRPLLGLLGVGVDAFRTAGGLLLLLTAFDMLRGQTSSCRCSPRELPEPGSRGDIAIIPVAIPLLAGPGSMATVMALTARNGGSPRAAGVVLAAVALTFTISYVVLRAASLLQRFLGEAVMPVVQRVLGLVLAAMALQLLAEGARSLLFG